MISLYHYYYSSSKKISHAYVVEDPLSVTLEIKDEDSLKRIFSSLHFFENEYGIQCKKNNNTIVIYNVTPAFLDNLAKKNILSSLKVTQLKNKLSEIKSKPVELYLINKVDISALDNASKIMLTASNDKAAFQVYERLQFFYKNHPNKKNLWLSCDCKNDAITIVSQDPHIITFLREIEVLSQSQMSNLIPDSSIDESRFSPNSP